MRDGDAASLQPPPITANQQKGQKPYNNYDAASKLIRMKNREQSWRLWDRTSVLYEGVFNVSCKWSTYLPYSVESNKSLISQKSAVPICLYPRERDIAVSGKIMDIGRWPDCDSLTEQLRQKSKNKFPVHLELGANIGSCILQVLFTTDAVVFAFEPHPQNLHQLTSTLLNLHDDSYRERVFLFPVALGEKSGESARINMFPTNAGNARLERTGHTTPNRGVNVPIERLDDVLYSEYSEKDGAPITFDQMKLDVQGFECFVLDGAKKVLAQTQKLVFEVEADQMGRFQSDCTPQSLVQRVQNSGFSVQRLPIAGKDDGDPHDLPDFSNFRGRDAVDLIATRN